MTQMESDPPLPNIESLAKGLEVKNLIVRPSKISITRSIDYSQLLLTADLGNGKFVDVTRMAKWSIEGEFGKVNHRGLFTPRKMVQEILRQVLVERRKLFKSR